MPQRNRPQLAVRQKVRDPLTACLDADSTYVCTAYSSRCYIIQKITSPAVQPILNPDAASFESIKAKSSSVDCYEIIDSEFPPLQGSVYMNGDVAKVPPGAVFTATSDPHVPSPTTEFNLLNGVAEPLDTYSDGGALPVGGQAPPDPIVPDTSQASPVAIDQLKQMLSSQLEYYFSRENLANDTYLLSQMDNDQYVPIWTVANFNQVKKLTTDIKLITEVLRESPNVQVDDEGQKVRPNHKRCIVILREVPESTPIEEVKGLFSGKSCPRLISCEFAHNNSWYVTFENDEDAQKAYRFLREEVREFQGKPIMARIKAKPMTINRLPLPTVGPGMTMKNGYRTPPATATAANVYDPATAYSPGQQRYLFNGSSLPPNVNYNHQVQIYFQQQPFYPPNVLQTWGPAAAAAYFDIGSVFTANGLAPQGFTKTHPSRVVPRRHKKTTMGLEQRSSLSDSGGVLRSSSGANKPLGPMKLDSTNPSLPPKPYYYRDPGQSDQSSDHLRHDHDESSSYRSQISASKDPLPVRRRRKEDEVVVGGPRGVGSPGPQFDLEADSFPPLPGHVAALHSPAATGGASSSSSASSTQASKPSAAAAAASPLAPATPAPTAALPTAVALEPSLLDYPQWADNRSVLSSAKVCPSEKVKTEEVVVVNGGGEPGEVVLSSGLAAAEPPVEGKGPPPSYNAAAASSPPETTAAHSPPTTATTATVASLPQSSPPQQSAAPPSQADLGVVKLSYAQVAQHHNEKAEREKNQMLQQQQLQSQQQAATGSSPAASQAPPSSAQTADDDRKEHSGYYPPKNDGIFGRGRGGSRGQTPRRRDNLQRFTTRQRSPK